MHIGIYFVHCFLYFIRVWKYFDPVPARNITKTIRREGKMQKSVHSPVRIFDECNVLHCTVGQPLLEGNTELLEARASGMDVVDRDGNVAVSFARLIIARRVASEGRVRLRAMVVRQLEHA